MSAQFFLCQSLILFNIIVFPSILVNYAFDCIHIESLMTSIPDLFLHIRCFFLHKNSSTWPNIISFYMVCVSQWLLIDSILPPQPRVRLEEQGSWSWWVPYTCSSSLHELLGEFWRLQASIILKQHYIFYRGLQKD